MTYNLGFINTDTFSARRLITMLAAMLTIVALSLGLAAPASAITSKITISTTVKNTLAISPDGRTATVPVTITCAQPSTANISIRVYQPQGVDEFGLPTATNAYGSQVVDCGPTPATYQIPVQVPYEGRPLQLGRADLTIDAADCDPNTSECTYSKRISRQVKLTN